ncbi:MAG: DNA-formamidopyrimidine glycosylase family protein, partial [Erysipelotrichaceae bacterium]
MPELPEVETVVRSLEKLIKNKRIIHVIVNYNKMIKTDINDFKNNLINQRFIGFKRRGKYLILELDDYILLSHLR